MHNNHPSHHFMARKTGPSTQAGHGSGAPPCPSDVAERAAALAEAAGVDREEAERRALAELGFSSWCTLSAAHAARIRTQLETLPPPCDAAGARLLGATVKLLDGPHWVSCVVSGWPIIDVFGVSEWMPRERSDVAGLVPRVAFNPRSGRRLERITDAGAEFREPDGRLLQWCRPSLEFDTRGVVPWWSSPAIINLEEAA